MAADRPRREAIMRVRMGGDEHARWTAAARAVGHPSLSSWVRALMDEAAATGGDGRAVAAALVALRTELGRGIGNNLNQIAHRLNGGQPVAGGALDDAGRAVREAQRGIDRALRAVRPPRPRAVLP